MSLVFRFKAQLEAAECPPVHAMAMDPLIGWSRLKVFSAEEAQQTQLFQPLLFSQEDIPPPAQREVVEARTTAAPWAEFSRNHGADEASFRSITV